MPGFDRTGPEGKGSQTGRKLGKCNPENNSSDESQIGRGQGRRFGRNKAEGNSSGRGLRNRRGLGRQ